MLFNLVIYSQGYVKYTAVVSTKQGCVNMYIYVYRSFLLCVESVFLCLCNDKLKYQQSPCRLNETFRQRGTLLHNPRITQYMHKS